MKGEDNAATRRRQCHTVAEPVDFRRVKRLLAYPSWVSFVGRWVGRRAGRRRWTRCPLGACDAVRFPPQTERGSSSGTGVNWCLYTKNMSKISMLGVGVSSGTLCGAKLWQRSFRGVGLFLSPKGGRSLTGTLFRDGCKATAGTCRAWFPLASWPLCWLAALDTTGEVSGRFPPVFLGTEQFKRNENQVSFLLLYILKDGMKCVSEDFN